MAKNLIRRHTVSLIALALASGFGPAIAQEIHYSGSTLSNPYLLDGGLKPAIGVHNIQTMRASRSRGLEAPMGTTVCPAKEHVLYPAEDSKGWTYNHQPMMAYWQGRFWMHYLSGPLGEHIPSSITWMQTSTDGYQWTAPQVLFPEYEIPADILSGEKKVYNADGSLHKVSDMKDYPNIYRREGLKAIMHQRVGWYVSSEATGSKLLAIGNYGICLHRKDDPNDGNGIGRVVREVLPDGSLGPIYFIYYNHGWNEKNTNYPFYTRSKDKKLRKAIEEILNSPLYWMQFVEECDRKDPHLPLNKEYKAFCYYTLPDEHTLVSLWKHALTSHSEDGGQTWDTLVHRAPGFVNSNAKIWGQRLTNGMYATVYNPSEFRWPLGISLSADGLDYQTLNLVHGDITQMRYGGNYKSNGPQYTRGILPGNGTPADNDLWVSYSVNKEDMWVSHIPVPVRTQATTHASAKEIQQATTLADLTEWNIYSPVLAPVTLKAAGASIVQGPVATLDMQPAALVLSDSDPFDYAKADRLFPAVRELNADFEVTPGQNNHGELQIEFCDAQGNPCSRLCFQPDGNLTIKTGARYTTVCKYEAGTSYQIKAQVNLNTRMIEVNVNANGKTSKKRAILYAPLQQIERITFRTGERRTDLTPDTKADRAEYEDLANAEGLDPKATFSIGSLKTIDANGMRCATHIGQDIIGGPDYKAQLLGYQKMHDYVNYFNTMEDEHVAQLIPNAQAADWMEQQIPLFECPDREMEEMYYYRWWTMRKHFVWTGLGYAQTEFLVKRSYSDTLNLIACAVSHHMMESRWLHVPAYCHDEAYNWLRLKNGEPMVKFHKFSDLVPYVLMQEAKVLGSTEYVRDLCEDLQRDMQWWRDNRRSTDGLYWQEDVQDGMEEQISGGKRYKGKNRYQQRPSINAYMAGNLSAISSLRELKMKNEIVKIDSDGEELKDKNEILKIESEELVQLMKERLWDEGLQFFTTRVHKVGLPKQGKAEPGDSLAQVRELIGYLPWYTECIDDDPKYAAAWLQLADKEGFDAPFGMTTAERRHPLFRHNWKPGKPTCEWDGAIWPFATSQTLTALINLEKHYPETAALVPDSLFFYHLKKYTESMHRRGRPYVGEYLDETDGQWLWGDHQRSRYYNHSSYCDLIITGVCGLTPSLDNELTIQPLLPEGQWGYFCLDGVRYHDHRLTVLWDEDGMRYQQGRGLTVLVDGKRVANRETLGALTVKLDR